MGKKIGCLSDTHGYLDSRLVSFLSECDEIWHAGDIGSNLIAEDLARIAPLKAVSGNIDDHEVRNTYPIHQRFTIEGLDVWITHIGGYPGNYNQAVKPLIFKSPPSLFVCGHSHILKVMNDRKLGLLHINPGAAGRSGIHKVQTAVRFMIEDGKTIDLEVIELQRQR